MTDDEIVAFLVSGFGGADAWSAARAMAVDIGPDAVLMEVAHRLDYTDRYVEALAVLGPHLRAGADSWAEAIARLSPEERREVVRAIEAEPAGTPLSSEGLEAEGARALRDMALQMELMTEAMSGLPRMADWEALSDDERDVALRAAASSALDRLGLDDEQRTRAEEAIRRAIDESKEAGRGDEENGGSAGCR